MPLKPVSVLFPAVGSFWAEDRKCEDWLLCPGGVHRDSDALARSNNRVILRDLAEVDPDGTDHSVERFGHWAVGWVEEIIVRPGTLAAKCAEEWDAALADYPIADETDFSNEEHEDALETWRNCYNDRERLAYIRENWSQFEQCKAEWYPANYAWRALLDNVRGRDFCGYASELLA